MASKIKVGIFCLENSPLLNLLKIYYSRFHVPKDIEIILIQAQIKLSEANIQRFRYRTQGIFEKWGDLPELPFKFVSVNSHTSESSIEIISNLDLDFGLNLGTHKKLTSELISVFRYGLLNCHPGNLPKYRGSCSVEWALWNSDPVVSTLHFMDEDIDTGPILNKRSIKTEFQLTYFEIRALILWNCVSQPLDWLSVFATNLHNSNFGAEPQKNGYFWKPIPENYLYDLIDKRIRVGKDQMTILNSVDITKWKETFMEI